MQYANAAPPAKLYNISSNIMHLYGLGMEHKHHLHTHHNEWLYLMVGNNH